MPGGEIHAIGDTLPELYVFLIVSLTDILIDEFYCSLLVGYGAKSHAYYIYCDECHQQFEEDPEYWCQWREEFDETDRKLVELWGA